MRVYLLIYRTFIGSLTFPERLPQTLPRNLTKYKGSAHWLLNFEAVKFALEQPIAQALNASLTPYFATEESFFQILNFNPQVNFPGGWRKNVSDESYSDPGISR